MATKDPTLVPSLGALLSSSPTQSPIVSPSSIAGYPADPARVLFGDGLWKKPPGFELSNNEFTSNVSVTATTEATANTVVTADAFAFDGVITVLVEFSSPILVPPAVVGAAINLWLYDGASSIGQLENRVDPAGATMAAAAFVRRRLTPSNASHTYSIRASVSAGTGTVWGGAGGVGAVMPGFIRITKA